MSAPRPVRGMHDLIGDDLERHRLVAGRAREIAGRYGFTGIATPILEPTTVFQRSLGDTSDVVTKEMYTFTDRGGDSVTLRPEGTASVCRALITAGLTQDLPQKLFYDGPMFRYERPQKGRLRQFHQIGIEIIGAPEPLADVEAIALGEHIIKALDLSADVTLELNTLGDPESRAAYREVLVAYLEARRAQLSADSQARLLRNPLRILDSKDPGDREVIAEAPLLHEYLSDDSRAFFDSVREGLERLGVSYTLSPRLVRGLDYYTHTAFELTTTALGAQAAVLAGGRYDGLVAAMGGPDIPGVGWAAGIERLAMLLRALPGRESPVAVVPIGDTETAAMGLAAELRAGGLVVELAYRGKVGQRLKRADRLGARLALLLGEDELRAGTVQLRDLSDGTQREVPREGLVVRLTAPPGHS